MTMGRKLFKLNSVLYLVIILLCVVVLLLKENCVDMSVDSIKIKGGGSGNKRIVHQPYPVEDNIAKREQQQRRSGKDDELTTAHGGKSEKSNNGKLVVTYDENDKEYSYGSDAPLIFIGGVPRSGTTLMRAMLDAHPDVRCGEETIVIPRILRMREHWRKNTRLEKKRLDEGGIVDYVIDSAITAFILEVIVKHGVPANRLCNKDPFTMKSADYLAKIFPKAKFLMMIRDGRATVHSIISRKVTISGFDIGNYRQCLEKWNQAVQNMYQQCLSVGDKRCKPVYYEQLVLHPKQTLQEILQFLDLPWNSSVLNHEKFVGDKISVSKVEFSSDQIIRPVNTDALNKWVGEIPQEVVNDMAKVAPMLAQLGYDPNGNPPKYGEADTLAMKKTEDMHKNSNVWDKKIEKLLGRKALPETKRSQNTVRIRM